MRAWLSQHGQAFRAALAKLAAQRAASFLNVLVFGIALSLPTGGYVVLGGLQGIAQRFSLEPQLSLFLDTGVKQADRALLENRLNNEPLIGAIRFVSREEALSRMRQSEGIAEVVAALNRNPLPDAFVLKIRDATPEQIETLAAELGKQPGVAQVQADAAWARRLAALIGIGRLAMGLLAALLATGLVAVTFNTIRLQVLTQREEIEVAKLLGATDAFIRRPFYYLGAIQGLAGGVAGLAILMAGLHLLNRGVVVLAQTYGSNFQLEFLPPADALAVGVLAGFLGWAGAFMSVSIYLRGIEPR